jgi:hypothetical protein
MVSVICLLFLLCLCVISAAWQISNALNRVTAAIRQTKPQPRAVRVLRVNRSTQEHEYLMDDGSVQTVPADKVVWSTATHDAFGQATP